MSRTILVYDTKNSYVGFNKDLRTYYAEYVDLKLAVLPTSVLLQNKPGNFELLFDNMREIKRDGIVKYYEYYSNDPRCITFRLYL